MNLKYDRRGYPKKYEKKTKKIVKRGEKKNELVIA